MAVIAERRVEAIMNYHKDLVLTALGRQEPDLTLKNARVFNVFTGEFVKGAIAVKNGRIAGIGHFAGGREIDLGGAYVTPGFIDSHVHIESGLVSPAQFARLVVPAGTTTVMADPHEIANVAGAAGLDYLLRATENLPLNVYVMLPSCVPATPLEQAGAVLTAADLAPWFAHPRVLGLGEMMNFPGVLNLDEQVWAKLDLAFERGRLVDGHAPGMMGPELTAYIAAGIGSDHEAITLAEARARLSQGLALMLRQGSAARNLLDLLPAVDRHTAPFCLLATDDRHPEDILTEGHINHLVRLAVEAGLEVAAALRLASFNAARHFRLYDLGALAPGYRADLLVFENLRAWRPALVFKDGVQAAENGCLTAEAAEVDDSALRQSIRLAPLSQERLRIKAAGTRARVIGLRPRQILTDALELEVPVVDGCFSPKAEDDLLKLAVFERHRASGRVGLGLVKGLGLKKGALASSVAHDSHNLVAVGANDDDLLLAAETVAEMGGGLAAVAEGRVWGRLPLPLGGLMTDRPMAEVRAGLHELRQAARALGVREDYDSFMTLAFLSLPVIPALKLTDAGLVDVNSFRLVPVSL